MPTDLAAIRRELLVAIRKGQRIYGAGYRCRWYPTEVTNPEDDRPFTPVGAWDFTAHLLESGHKLEEVAFDIALDRKAYVMKVEIGPTKRQLYIKLTQAAGGIVVGRSFHYSDYDPGRQ